MAAEPVAVVRGDAHLRKSPGSNASKTEISLERQLDDIKARMAADGVALDMVHEDVHPRWELWERPALSVLRERIKAKRVDVVYAWDTSRLATGLPHQAILLEEGQRHGVEYRFVNERIDPTSPLGQLMWAVTSTFNAMELERIRDRTNGGKKKHLERGELLFYGKKGLYGYRFADEARTRMVVYEPEAAVIRRLFREVCAGATVGDLAVRLTAEGVPTPGRSRVWQTSTLLEDLHNPAYKGQAAVNRTERVRTPGRWVRRRRPEADWHRLPDGCIPALVAPDQWQRAQEALDRHRTQAPRGMAPDRQAEFLLRGGLATCAHCGRPLHALTVPRRRDYAPDGGKVIYRTYACASLSRQRAERVAMKRVEVGAVAGDGYPVCTSPVRVRAEALDLAVWRRVLQELQAPPARTDGARAAARQRATRAHAEAVAAVRSAERLMANIAAELIRCETEEERAPLRGQQRLQGATLRAAQARRDEAGRALAGLRETEAAELARFRDYAEHAVVIEGLIPGKVSPLEYGTMRGILEASGVRVVVWHKDAPEASGAPPVREGAGRYAVLPYEGDLWCTGSGSSCSAGGYTLHTPDPVPPPTAPDPERLARLVRALARGRAAPAGGRPAG
jgi:site-specific DNA recombinase